MKRTSTCAFLTGMLSVALPCAISGAAPQSHSEVTIEGDGCVPLRDSAREAREIRTYSAQVDRFIAQNGASRRDLVNSVDEATARWAGWTEVTGNPKAISQALAGAFIYKRSGRVVRVECFGRSRAKESVNRIRYYFRPDGTLAKSRAIIRTFLTPNLDNNVVAFREMFYDKRGFVFASNEEFRHAKTGKKLKWVDYNAQLQAGIDLYRMKRLRDLPFFDLLAKPPRK